MLEFKWYSNNSQYMKTNAIWTIADSYVSNTADCTIAPILAIWSCSSWNYICGIYDINRPPKN